MDVGPRAALGDDIVRQVKVIDSSKSDFSMSCLGRV